MHADAVSGGDGPSALSSAEKLDENTATWSYIADLSPGRFGVAVAAAGGFLFAIGGASPPQHTGTYNTAATYNTDAKYDPSTNVHGRPSPRVTTQRCGWALRVIGVHSKPPTVPPISSQSRAR